MIKHQAKTIMNLNISRSPLVGGGFVTPLERSYTCIISLPLLRRHKILFRGAIHGNMLPPKTLRNFLGEL
jgi:hypothetical protein